MAPNISPWKLINSHNRGVSGSLKPLISESYNGSTKSKKEIVIERLDNELARLRAMDVELISEKRKLTVKVPLGRFKAESVSITVNGDKLLVVAEEGVSIDDKMSVVTKLTRRVVIPSREIRTDIMTSYLSPLGVLTLTFLKK
ncbi:unnamed protein product [Bursaphelenchus okinawaensis]|uniref:SHSP domain-containing protein n=1 Tax=Bursaphelenchus okinawaensis TaxID=465554 RepID=A0A811KXS0_9BILA|nr:unnamed protein product [Bursaphelenchus okinawaensis]CAG9113563.1 unnamed protein product [Bursaphelenchus okinawaensis]